MVTVLVQQIETQILFLWSQLVNGFIDFAEVMATLLMEVIVEVVHIWVIFLFDVPLVLLNYGLLASFLHRQQIDTKCPIILLTAVVEVFFKRLTGQSVATTDVDFGSYATLLKKYRHTSSDLNFRCHILVHKDDLLGLHKVGDPSLLV